MKEIYIVKICFHLARVDGFYILYRPRVGQPPGFTSITVLHAAATRYDNAYLTRKIHYLMLTRKVNDTLV